MMNYKCIKNALMHHWISGVSVEFLMVGETMATILMTKYYSMKLGSGGCCEPPAGPG